MTKTVPQHTLLQGWMTSLADQTRLRLLRLVERHELGVAELCGILQAPQSTVSRHLKVLADQGWVRSRRSGATHLYRMVLDELDPAARKLWLLAREQTDDWATVRQDELRLVRRLRHRDSGAEAFFAGAAGKWDTLRRQQYGDSFIIAAMLSLLPSDLVVADLGCGAGQLVGQLAEQVGRVIGVDSSAAMLRAARKRIAGRHNVELLHGDLVRVPLPDAACDAALLLLVLTYVPHIDAVLREARRVIRPGGRVVIVDLLEHDRDDFRRQMGQQHAGFSPERMIEAMIGAGFVEVTCRPVPPESAAKGPALFVASGLTTGSK